MRRDESIAHHRSNLSCALRAAGKLFVGVAALVPPALSLAGPNFHSRLLSDEGVTSGTVSYELLVTPATDSPDRFETLEMRIGYPESRLQLLRTEGDTGYELRFDTWTTTTLSSVNGIAGLRIKGEAPHESNRRNGRFVRLDFTRLDADVPPPPVFAQDMSDGDPNAPAVDARELREATRGAKGSRLPPRDRTRRPIRPPSDTAKEPDP